MQTRSGNEFSPYTLSDATMPPVVTALQGCGFDVAPLIARAIKAEHEDQEDCEEDDEHGDPLNDIDEEWPPPPPSDPWNEVDDENPTFVPTKKPRRQTTFQDVVTSSTIPLTGPHRRRPAKLGKAERLAKLAEKAQKKRDASHCRRNNKRLRNLADTGHIPSPASVAAHVQCAVPLATELSTADLPAAFGAYSAKVEDKSGKYGSQVRRSLTDLIGLGFRIVEWDGMYAPFAHIQPTSI
jgi:hypothetical protein